MYVYFVLVRSWFVLRRVNASKGGLWYLEKRLGSSKRKPHFKFPTSYSTDQSQSRTASILKSNCQLPIHFTRNEIDRPIEERGSC